MSTWIWKDHPLSLRIAVVVATILFLLLAGSQIHSWSTSSESLVEPSLATLYAVTSFGLIRMKSWARWVTVTFLGILVVVLVIGVINPFMAGDWMSAGMTPPSVATLLAFIVPAEVVIIWMLHILGKYKDRFE